MRKATSRVFKLDLFAKRLAILREKTGHRQREIAQAVKRTVNSYSMIESGKVMPSVDLLIELRNFFEREGQMVTLDYLFGISDTRNEILKISELEKNVDKLEKELKHCQEVNALLKDNINLLKKG